MPLYETKAARDASQDIVVSRRSAGFAPEHTTIEDQIKLQIVAYLSMEPFNKRCPGSFTEPSPFT